MDRMQPPGTPRLDARGPRAHHRRMHRELLTFGLCAAAAIGQARPSKPPVLVDGVIATVNDSPILLSELKTLVDGRIRGAEAREGQLSPKQRAELEQYELLRLLNKHRMAQAAKTFGDLPPEQVEQILRREIEREKQDQVREFGSPAGFSRELLRQGRTFASYEQDLRTDRLSDVAEELAIGRRLQRQTNLLVTPRMLRQAYAANRDYFVRPASAQVAQVRFEGTDARKNAEAAAAEWRKTDLHARQIAGKHQGTAIPDVRVATLAPELAAVATFALAGPEDAVSEPIPFRGGFHVAKVTQFAAARDGRFEDPEVQAQLRRQCERDVQNEFTIQAYERAKQRTEAWVSKMPW